MDASYPINQVPATPEYVLDVLNQYLWCDGIDDCLTFETPIGRLVGYFDDLSSSEVALGRLTSSFFKFEMSKQDWWERSPGRLPNTVGDLCEFVAERLQTRPAIRPWHSPVGECLPAGAFLTIRSMLADTGVNADEIGPSTRLEPYLLREGWFTWKGWLSQLYAMCPGRLPRFRQYSKYDQTVTCGVALGAVLLTVGVVVSLFGEFGHFLIAAATTMLLVCIPIRLARPLPPRSANLGNLVTFRDLACALAGPKTC